MTKSLFVSFFLMIAILDSSAQGAQNVRTDSVVKRIVYKDTVVYRYRYDTIRIKHFVHSDTAWTTPAIAIEKRKKGFINQANWGIGPSLGAYYSPYNGFDVNIGFGIQYYLLAVPSFRNPHLGHRKKR
jgi:hypothetical protein